MKENGVTLTYVAGKMGVTYPAVIKMLKAESVSPERHRQFIALHFPLSVLPRAEKRRSGPTPKLPVWEREAPNFRVSLPA